MNIWIWRFYFGVRWYPAGLRRVTLGYCRGNDPRNGVYIHVGNMDEGFVTVEK